MGAEKRYPGNEVGTFRPVVSQSMCGTLMPIFKGFVLFFIIIIFLLFKENLSELQACLGN